MKRWAIAQDDEIWPKKGKLGPPVLLRSYWQGFNPRLQWIFAGCSWTTTIADAETYPTKRAAVGAYTRVRGKLETRTYAVQVEVQS